MFPFNLDTFTYAQVVITLILTLQKIHECVLRVQANDPLWFARKSFLWNRNISFNQFW